MFGLGIGEIIIIILAALVILGPKKIPEMARSLANGLRAFRNATDDLKREIYSATEIEENKFNQKLPSSTHLQNPKSKQDDNLDDLSGPISR